MVDNDKLKQIVAASHSKSDVARELNLPINGSGMKRVENLIKDLDTSHFNRSAGHAHRVKYPVVEKKCPVCSEKFSTREGHPREKTTCSYACSNTFFRSEEDNPNFKNGSGTTAYASYRYICFKYHDHKCVVCDENNILDVHHYDENNKNNKPENLVPLCPTHHRYWHSKFRYLVKEIIDTYLKKFKEDAKEVENS